MYCFGNLVFRIVSLFLQVLDMGLCMLFLVMACHWVVVGVIHFLQRWSSMLGHRMDACASHLMFAHRFGCLLHRL